MSQSSPLPARIFQPHQPQITSDLLATLKPICFPDNQHERQCGQSPLPQGGFSTAALPDISPLPARSPASVRQSSGSAHPATSANPPVAGSTGLEVVWWGAYQKNSWDDSAVIFLLHPAVNDSFAVCIRSGGA